MPLIESDCRAVVAWVGGLGAVGEGVRSCGQLVKVSREALVRRCVLVSAWRRRRRGMQKNDGIQQDDQNQGWIMKKGQESVLKLQANNPSPCHFRLADVLKHFLCVHFPHKISAKVLDLVKHDRE